MLAVEEKIINLTEDELKVAYNEFVQFKENGYIEQSLIRNLYNEHRTEIGSNIGYWIAIELMVMSEIARRYYS